jgi:hypothetical protein
MVVKDCQELTTSVRAGMRSVTDAQRDVPTIKPQGSLETVRLLLVIFQDARA